MHANEPDVIPRDGSERNDVLNLIEFAEFACPNAARRPGALIARLPPGLRVQLARLRSDDLANVRLPGWMRAASDPVRMR